MLRSWEKRGHGAAVVLAAGLAVAVAAVCSAVALARPLSFLHIRANLSRTATFASAYPDLSISPDGEQVVAAWMEGYTEAGGYKGHVLLRFASEAGAGWSNNVTVFSGDGNAYAYDAAVAVADATAHVAYVVFDGSLNRTEVRYTTCNLDQPQTPCDDPQLVASVDPGIDKITWVDLALDQDGNPHVVWAQYDTEEEGDILYWYWAGDASEPIRAPVAQTGDNGKPAIVCADGYAHVVWQEETTQRIAYWRRAPSGDTVTTDICPAQATFPPGNPDVAAQGGRVFVVWDWCAGFDGSLCRQYTLAYRRSNDWGSTWGDVREVGTDRLSLDKVYYSTDTISSDEMSEYGLYLEPSIALNSGGWPAVVWHAEDPSAGPGVYAIYYTYADTGAVGGDRVGWAVSPSARLIRGTVGSAAVVVGQTGSDPPLHFAYMQEVGSSDWDVFYGSNHEDRYYYRRVPVLMQAYPEQ